MEGTPVFVEFEKVRFLVLEGARSVAGFGAWEPAAGYVSSDTTNFIPSKFIPPSPEATPALLYRASKFQVTTTTRLPFAPFPTGTRTGLPFHRYVRRTHPDEILITTDGACSNNGQGGAVGGCGFIYYPSIMVPSTSAYANNSNTFGTVAW